MIKFLALVDKLIDRFASYALIVTVFFMLIFSFLIISLRWVNMNYPWFESLVRHLVFISIFLGGIIATGRGSHIGIDVLSKFLESKNLLSYKRWVERIVSIASSFTLLWLVMASYQFMKVEVQFGRALFLGIHSSVLVGIIPVGFSLIAYRFLFKFVNSFSKESR